MPIAIYSCIDKQHHAVQVVDRWGTAWAPAYRCKVEVDTGNLHKLGH